MKSIIALVLALKLVSAAQNWDGLRVTWNLNFLSDYAFTPMPRLTVDTTGANFVFKDDFCGDDAKFRGLRYWYKNDPATVLLYDKAGYIAGIQTLVPKSQYTPSAQNNGHPFVEDGEYWALTAYFVDPSIICTTGRTSDQYASQGTGDRLVIQNGTDAIKNQLPVPLTQDGADASTWTKGHCFWTMGLHYWYNVRKDMSCDEFFPFFLLYNNAKLNAFGFAINAGLTSKRYEHPTASISGQFIDPVPDCFFSDATYNTLSTIHIYMNDSPRSTSNC
jgi:charged multivesicular body protein 7